MDKNNGNAIRRARTGAGFTQEKAAEMSGYSVDTIQAWEGGSRRPSVQALDMLGICFGAPWLTAVYLREQSEGGSLSGAIPEFTPGEPLPQAVLTLLDRICDFGEKHRDRRLMSIAADGKITQEERPEFDEILNDLQGIIQAVMVLKYSKAAEGGAK